MSLPTRFAAILFAFLSPAAQAAPEYTFTTIAGPIDANGSADGTGSAARFSSPSALANDAAGNIYVADSANYTIRKVTPAGVVTTLAGLAGATGAIDGRGSAARFGAIYGIAVSLTGEIYVSDYDNHAIRRISADGTVSTFAGLMGELGSTDGAGTAARFRSPAGIALDSAGTIFIADRGNRTIRRITPAGVVSTFAGVAGSGGNIDGTGSSARFTTLSSIAVDPADNLYVSENANAVIRKITPAGVVTTLAGSPGVRGATDGAATIARFSFPSGLAADATGNLFVADTSNQTVRKVTPEGVVSTFAGSNGILGSAQGVGRSITFNYPYGLIVDREGNVIVSEAGNHTLRRLTPAAESSVLAGSGGSFGTVDGPARSARFQLPASVGSDRGGNVFVTDSVNSTIRRIAPNGTVSTFAGLVGAVSSTDGTGTASRFGFPYGLAVDAFDSVYVIDKIFGTVRRLTPEAVSSTLAGQNSTLLIGAVDGQGAMARFNRPSGVAADRQGNLYVADTNNHTIRKVAPDGNVTTVAGTGGVSGSTNATGTAARFSSPNDVAVDAEGNLYVADTNNHTIRRISTTGAVTTLAGLAGIMGSANGPGSSAQFNYPTGVAVDSRGTIFVADSTNGLIRRIDPSGSVTTIGGRVPLFVGECADGTGTAARFSGPVDVAVDPHDALLIVDATSNRIVRGVLDTIPTITRQPQALPVTPGSRAVFTVAGTGGGLSYQWFLNGAALPGATTASFTVPSAQAAHAGAYTVALTNSAGTTVSRPAALTVITTSDVGRVSNLAIRSNAGTGGQTLIVGFALGGPGTSGNKPILMRGIGPALGAFGLTGYLPDPKFELFASASGTRVHENDNWAGDSQVTAVSARVGAFAFPSASSRDAALYLPSFSTGSYTLQISGADSATGIALAEIYDASAAGTFTSTTPRLVNVSARTQVGTEGDVLIAGFYIGGLTAKTVLIRAIGPTLTLFGVPGALGDPNLELFTGATKIDENDNWGGDRELATAFASVGAFPLSPSSRDAALLVTLAPGSYTAQISGVGNTTGVALVEVYEVP